MSRPVARPAGPRRWAPLAVLALGALVAGWLLLTYRPAPVVPRDGDHVGSRAPDGCLTCHGPGGSHPQPPNHPINEACFSCHRWP